MDLFCNEKVNNNECEHNYLETASTIPSLNHSSSIAGSTNTYSSNSCSSTISNTSFTSSSATATTATTATLNFTTNRPTNKALRDPVFLQSCCLENLIKVEECKHEKFSEFEKIQKDVTPAMRKMVAQWIIEICDEQKCEEVVSILALHYLDRYLNTSPVQKTHLQILGAACLLLAAKLREPSIHALPIELLVFYTDYSISKRDLINWELLVLSKLKWDISSVTPLDFLELLIIRLPIKNHKCLDILPDKIIKHAQAFISLAAREHYFSMYSPSTIAASSIAASLSGLKWHLRSGTTIEQLLNNFTDLTGVHQEDIYHCMLKMEELFQEQKRLLPLSNLPANAKPMQQVSYDTNNTNDKTKMLKSTPTDVQDVEF